MPEVRRFFYDAVLRGDYGNKLRVQFIPGAMPELVLFGADKQEIAREDVSGLNFDQLHELVQAKGFKQLDPSDRVEQPALSSDEDPFGGPPVADFDDDYFANDAVDEAEAEFQAQLAAEEAAEEEGQEDADLAEGAFPDGQEEAAAEEEELARAGGGSGSAEL